MRFVHTSDWHAGRVWRGLSRLTELERVLDHLAQYLERERIELLLVTGDVFDNGAPSAEAERIVFQFFCRVGRARIPSVVIAGNHDSPSRMEAWGALAELVSVHAIARPRGPDQGGVLELTTRSNENVLVAALPFASAGAFVSATALAEDDTRARRSYCMGLAQLSQQLSARFRDDAVNLFLAHTHLDGARLSESEREVHVTDAWTALPSAFPASATYVALGHLHRPQRMDSVASPAYYAGSPMQLDFGEVGDVKSFVVVEASAGKAPLIELVRYEGARGLRDVRATLHELEGLAPTLGDLWLRVHVPVERRDHDLSAKVRLLLPNAIVIQDEVAPGGATKIEDAAQSPSGPVAGGGFAAYFLEAHGCPADQELLAEFEALRLRTLAEEP